MKKNIHFLCTVLVLLILIVGCTKTDSKNQNVTQKEEKELVVVSSSVGSNLEPTQPNASFLRLAGIIETLFYPTTNGSIVPLLAKDSKQIDEKTWEIYLKNNATFWSGKKVDAKAVIGAFKRSSELNVKSKAVLDTINLSEKDEFTILVKTKTSNVDVPRLLINELVYNPELDYKSLAQVDFTGPYQVTEYNSRQSMKLKRFENYHDDKAKIKNILFEEISNAQTRVLSINSGRVDICSAIPVTAAKELKNNQDVTLFHSSPSASLSVYLNLQKDFLKDKKVRQALSWGTDRDELVQIGAEGFGYPVSTWLGSNPEYKEARNAVYDKYDLEKAKTLLTEAGWTLNKDGKREKNAKIMQFKLYTFGNEKTLGELIQDQWTRLGIEVSVNHVDYSVIKEARKNNDWDGLIESWTNYGDVYSMLQIHFGVNGGANYGKYINPKLDPIFEKLKNAQNNEQRHKYALQINKIVSEDAPLITTYPRPALTAVKNNVQGFQPHFMQAFYIITNKLEYKN